MTGYVYFISDGVAVKIGIARLVGARLRDLQTGNTKQLSVLHTIETNEPRKVEGWLHWKYSDRRIVGEWFALTASDIDDVKAMNLSQGLPDKKMVADGMGKGFTFEQVLSFLESAVWHCQQNGIDVKLINKPDALWLKVDGAELTVNGILEVERPARQVTP
jgi:hypothetical protein